MLVIGFIRENAVLRKIAKTKNEIDVGISAPDFELPDQYGQPVKLSSFKGMRNVLLIFLRGDWCPACHMMMRTYEKSSAKLREKNILLLAIGPDDLGVNKQMAEKLGIEYRILADAKQEVAIAYGTHLSKEFIPGPGGPDYEEGFPLPSSFLICDKGIIRYRSRVEDVGEFLSPDTVFEVLAKI